MKKIINKIYLIAIIGFLIFPFASSAALLYLSPAEGTYGPGDNFSLDIILEVDENCINTVEAYIDFPQNYLNLAGFITGESIVSIWLDKPGSQNLNEINSKGEIYFAGGIPGGYCGKIPGDPGNSNIVAKLIFQVPGFIMSDEKKDFLNIDISSRSRALINDGQGTEDKLVKRGALIKFSRTSTGPETDWLEVIQSDNIEPEPFFVELHQRPDIFNNRYYIIFFAVDKQTGVDHYEVLEIGAEEEVGIKPKVSVWEKILKKDRPAPAWKIAQMPYVLKDQTLRSIIKVKAVDKAGNERIVEYIPPLEVKAKEEAGWKMTVLLPAAGLGLLILSIVAIIILIIKNKRNQNDDEE